MTDIRTILRRTTRDLTASGSPSPRLDAEVLLMHLLKTDRLQLCTHPERDLDGGGGRRIRPMGRETLPGRTGRLHRRGEGVLVASLRGQPRGPHPAAGDGMPHRRGPGALSAASGGSADHRYRNGERCDRRRPGRGSCPRPGWWRRTSRAGRSGGRPPERPPPRRGRSHGIFSGGSLCGRFRGL